MPAAELSIVSMFLNADPIVQGVMGLLFLISLASWVIIIEKILLLRRVGREISFFQKTAARGPSREDVASGSALARALFKSGLDESRDGAGGETRADFRERVERAMRQTLAVRLDRVGERTLFLATAGAVSPFVGLFGTVWGIMHSFAGIAASGETTLAVVAPGIAEALFATALGLAAAIPAVVAYNKITATLKKTAKEALLGVSLWGNHLARLHFSRGSAGE